MASIRIHQDQENIGQDLRNQKQMAGIQQKRAVLGVIDANKARNVDKNVKGKQPLGLTLVENIKKASSSLNQENDALKENKKNFSVPVAQFEAFKVYEDYNDRMEKIQERLKAKASHEIYKGTADDRYYTKTEVAEIRRKKAEEEAQRIAKQLQPVALESPMSIEKSFSDSLENPVDILFNSGKSNKDIFFELEEYRADIYVYLRERELLHRPKPGYMKKQPDVTSNMRTILVDWLVEVAEEYKLHTETLYLAVNFIDRFLSYMSVVRAKLQLVGTAAMFLASKYEEIYPPDISEFVYITDDTYNKRQVIRMEHLILKVLGFDISIPTPLTFIQAISITNKLSEKTSNLAMYISELSMLNGEMYLEFLPSTIAASAIALARHTLGQSVWTADLADNTSYSLAELRSCIEFLSQMQRMAPSNAQHAIQDKYSSQKYMLVSNIKFNEAPIFADRDDSL